ncbi:MAG: hypothetical protein K2M00_08355, partial [Muribaculaceae bacterium]|nr:hypothetical protein [Muribaculaceae bacterium]
MKTRPSTHQPVRTHPGASDKLAEAGASTELSASGTSTNGFAKRKSPRAIFHNYSGGDYFITICTHNKEHYFGEIIDGEMQFTEIGRVAHCKLEELSKHYN